MKQMILLSVLGFSCITVTSDNRYKACCVDDRNIRAVEYVGTRPTGGIVQLQLLQMEGLQNGHYVLEVGCGALMSGIPIMSYLEKGHYVGIDPNSWLMNQSLLIVENQQVVEEKSPIFIHTTDFDASLTTNILFDYVFAHSIMSHAADWQLSLFFKNISKVLKKNGKAIFSIRLTEPNEYGNEGASQETHAQEWQYPGCSFFSETTVTKEALRWFDKVERKKGFTALLTADSPGVCHDWFVLTK